MDHRGRNRKDSLPRNLAPREVIMSAWKHVFAEARDAAAEKLGARREEARSSLDDVANAHKDSLQSLLTAYVDGRIDRETFDGELSDARRAFRAELLGVRGIRQKGAGAAAIAFF